MAVAAVRFVYRALADGVVALIDEVHEAPTFVRLLILFVIGLLTKMSLFGSDVQWIYEDTNWLPLTQTTSWSAPFVLSHLLSQAGLGTPVGHHVLNLAIHAIVSLLVGSIGARLWQSSQAGWAAGTLFWLNPMAIAAIGYATAIQEMCVALGACLAAWILIRGWTWYGVLAAAVVIGMTLLVKTSAIGVALVPVVMLLIRPIAWRASSGWILAVAFIGFIGIYDFIPAGLAKRPPYDWILWPEEMLSQSSSAYYFAINAIIPVHVAFQYDWAGAVDSVLRLTLMAIPCAIFWIYRRTYAVEAFAAAWVVILIGVRLVFPSTIWPERAPELIYAQQFYPALPGMIWLIVSLGRRWIHSCYPVPTFLEGSSI